jgi:AcrR family transcriptional regulator
LDAESNRLLKNRLANAGVGRPRSPAVDRAILHAALKLFVELGFDSVTFEHIAETAGVARTTVYRRWSSKEALIAQAIAVERGEPEQIAAAREVSSGDLANQLLDAVSEVVTSPNYLKVIARLIGSLPDHPELMSIYWDSYLVPRRNAMRSLVERFRADGLIRNDANADILLDLLGGAIMHHVLIQPGKPSAEELRTYLLSVLRELGMSDAQCGPA